MAIVILVWTVNLMVGAGLLLLGMAMVRRPQRVWVGVRVARTPEEIERTRRANGRTAPWLLLLGAVEVVSGPIALAGGISPLTLAITGLVTLLLAIAVVAVSALQSR